MLKWGGRCTPQKRQGSDRRVPAHLATNTLVSMFKSDNTEEAKDYRTIMTCNLMGKLYGKIVERRISLAHRTPILEPHRQKGLDTSTLQIN